MEGVDLKRKHARVTQNAEAISTEYRAVCSPTEISAKLREIGNLVGEGLLITEAIRRIGIAESTYYRWRANLSRESLWEASNATSNDETKLKTLESENSRLRSALTDLIIERQILKEVVYRK